MELEGGRNASTGHLMRKGAHVRIKACHIRPACNGILIRSARLLMARDLAQISLRSFSGGTRFAFSMFKARRLSRARRRAAIDFVYISGTMA
jgi:hypothetical protein